MKKIIFLIPVLSCLCISALIAQCNPYYNLKNGTEYEMTSYNAKDKQEGRQVTKITDLEENSNGWKAKMSFKSFDKKDKLVMEKDDVEISCEDGVVQMDMQRFLPEESMAAFRDMNMKIEVDNIELPSDLSVGKTLDDGSITVSGDIPMTMNIMITDRKVEAKEKVTTPAGTFDCYKVTYSVKMKMVMNRETKGVEWITKDVGVVKSEVYNNGGKLMGYSLLTDVK